MSLQDASPDYSADTAEESTAVEGPSGIASLLPFEAVGFWLAVTLPVPTVLLLAGNISTSTELAAISGLLTANLLAFYVGREYSTDDR